MDFIDDDNSGDEEKPLITGTDTKMVITTKLGLGTIKCYEHYHLYENEKTLYHEKPFEFATFVGTFKGKVIIFHKNLKHPVFQESPGKQKTQVFTLWNRTFIVFSSYSNWH